MVTQNQTLFCCGKDSFLKSEFIYQLKQEAKASAADGTFAQFDPTDKSLESIASFVQSADFFGSSKIAVIGPMDTCKVALLQKFESLMPLKAPSVKLIFTMEASSPTKNAALTRLSKDALIKVFHEPFERDIPSHVLRLASKRSLKIKSDAISALVELTDYQLSLIDNALETLAMYLHPCLEITKKDVETFFSAPRQSDIYELFERVIEADVKKALKNYRDLKTLGLDPYEVMGAFVFQFERFSKVYESCVKQGRALESVCADLRIHSFFVNALRQQLKKVSQKRFERITGLLLEFDRGIKTGQKNPNLEMEVLISKLCRD